MSDDSSFFIVWCPTGRNPPSRRHWTLKEAQTEAERLASSAPLAEFFVMEAVSRSKKVSVTTTMLDRDNEIPF